MPVGTLRALVVATNVAAHGVAVTVTRPAPDDVPVATTGVWRRTPQESMPVSTDFRRAEPRKILQVPRTASLPTLPRGSIVLAPDETDGVDKTWQIEGFSDDAEPDFWLAFVALVNEG